MRSLRRNCCPFRIPFRSGRAVPRTIYGRFCFVTVIRSLRSLGKISSRQKNGPHETGFCLLSRGWHLRWFGLSRTTVIFWVEPESKLNVIPSLLLLVPFLACSSIASLLVPNSLSSSYWVFHWVGKMHRISNQHVRQD